MTYKKYWKSLEERIEPSIEEWKKPEFASTVQEMLKEAKNKKLNRKNFFKFMGASAWMVQTACRRPTEQIIPAIIQSPEYTPGEKVYYASSTPEGTGIIIHTREGRPIKIAGNPNHPLTKGGVSGSEVASLLDLYDPDRLRYPVYIKNQKKVKAKRDEIISQIQQKIESNNYVLITGPIQSPSTKKLINEFIKQFPNGKHIEFRPDQSLRQIVDGQNICYNKSILPSFSISDAQVIVSIEADFLGSLPGSVIYTKEFTEKRNLNKKNNEYNSLIVFESMFTITGSNADHRYPIKPGDAYLIALSLAYELNNELKIGPYAKENLVIRLLNNYSPDKLEPITGIKKDIIKTVAQILARYKSKSLVITGSPLTLDGTLNAQIAVNLLNSILENDGYTIDYENPQRLSSGDSFSTILKVLESIQKGEIKTVLLANANLVYHLPKSLDVAGILQKADFVVSFSDRIDETGILSNAVLPLSHYLESWGEVEIRKGIRSVIQPTIRPLYDTLSLEDYLIQLAYGSLGNSENFYQYLKKEWSQFAKGNFTDFWVKVLQNGYYEYQKLTKRNQPRKLNLASLEQLPKEPVKSNGFRIGLFYNISVYDGTGGNNAYRQELPDPVTKIVWTNYAAILPDTARKLKLTQGSIVEIKTKDGVLKLPLQLQPGLHPEAILIPLGYGRTNVGKTGNGIGDDALKIASIEKDSLKLVNLIPENSDFPFKKTGEKITIPCTQTVYRKGRNTEDRAFFAPTNLPNAPYDGSSQYDRQIVLETSFTEYQRGWKAPKQPIEYPENAKLMPEWEYDRERWHMVIDLNACTGCGACITSCNIENNIPTVGAEEVSVGREMHWMRIDRYYSGDESNPEVVHQPMLCQQCGNAPCENVCPVGATSHSDDGINVMVYNRCIGTRYCANNCPYKVRRFNWFENWNYMEGLVEHLREPQHLAMNPDVTVRRRGVIEKCNFCLQRINRARQDSKIKGLPRIQDGMVKTACQEVCPANAIYFGDINDPNSEVSRLVKNGRGYKVLDFLGVKPSITYLAKVRNPIVNT
ncbi:MAG: TAT-variant-translocated molybdopterin oxidoreductase [Leptonema sp. (in: bacteria)]